MFKRRSGRKKILQWEHGIEDENLGYTQMGNEKVR